MKWVIIGLFGLGLAAAVCAAMLVVSFHGDDSSDGAAHQAQVLVAKHDIEAMSVVDSDAVELHSVAVGAVPAGALTDPVQAIGHMLLAGVGTGQSITSDNFVADSSATRLAASLRPGNRAVNVLLSDTMGMENLLGPGSVVDVIASLEMKGSDASHTEPVSITLLQGVRVLAVGGKMAVSTTPTDGSDSAVSRNRPTVTLLVDAPQAERLKLAMQQGSVSLALRNPKDAERVDVMGAGLASLSPIFNPPPKPKDSTEPVKPMPMLVPESLQHQWETVIVRGGVAETKSFSQFDSGHNR